MESHFAFLHKCNLFRIIYNLELLFETLIKCLIVKDVATFHSVECSHVSSPTLYFDNILDPCSEEIGQRCKIPKWECKRLVEIMRSPACSLPCFLKWECLYIKYEIDIN